VNQSGLIDANLAGGSSRTSGVDPLEIQIDALPEMTAVNTFTNKRGNHGRYETLEELAKLNNGITRPIESFSVYSLSREGEGITTNGVKATVTPKIDIGGNVVALQGNKGPIMAGLQKICTDNGVPPTEANFIFNSLVDYVDVDREPYSLDAPYVEAAPMISEIIVTNTALPSPPLPLGWYRHEFKIEVCYPFVQKPAVNFMLSGHIRVAAQNVTKGLSFNKETNFVRVAYNTSDTNMFVPLANNYIVQTNGCDTGDQLTFTYSGKFWITEAPGGWPTNDYVPFMGDTNTFLPLGAVTLTAGSGAPVEGKECIDPRFNWKTTPPHWMPSVQGSTIDAASGGTNKFTKIWLNQIGKDEGMKMSVSSQGWLFSAGELGCLLQGSRDSLDFFKTLRLYNKGVSPFNYKRDKIYETFYTKPANILANGYTPGRISLNAKNSDVLMAAFNNCPVGYSMSTNYPLNYNQATSIVGIIHGGANKVYYDIGEIGETNAWPVILPDLSDCERESIISGSSELLTTRQNLFTIFLTAQTSVGGMAGGKSKKLASAHAVVDLWRDPFPSFDAANQAYHKMFIRQFRITEE